LSEEERILFNVLGGENSIINNKNLNPESIGKIENGVKETNSPTNNITSETSAEKPSDVGMKMNIFMRWILVILIILPILFLKIK
jgi:hypothetical protein